MRLLHTADWHLGRLFYGVHLTEDQAYVLDQFVDLVADTQPDAVLISGDIYDRAVPPPEAIRLLDETLCRIIQDCKTPVFILAGNHDSPERLGFASRLLGGQMLYVYGQARHPVAPVLLEDKAGPLSLYAVPYMEPAMVRSTLGDPEITCHQSAMKAWLDRIRATHPAGQRAVLMTHAFVRGGDTSESERPLSVGGAGSIDAGVFDGFDYVALGHLHRPQNIGERIHYSGSLLKYSFAEADHSKSVTMVDIDGAGQVKTERIPLSPRRDVRRINGFLQEILDCAPVINGREDYLEVSLLDSGAILDPIGKLRERYPNVLHVDRPVLKASLSRRTGRQDHRKTSPVELFESFFREVTGNPLEETQKRAYLELLDEMARQEREALS